MRAAALAAAALFLWALADVSPALYRPGEAIDTDVYHSGEMLLHRIKYRATTENYHLPLSSISSALLHNHVPPGDGTLRRRLSAAAAFLLLLALGVELGAPACGLLAAALLLFVSRFPLPVSLEGSWHGHWGHLQSFFTLLVLAAAGLMARHLRAPSRAGAWAVALALGAALLYRSTLVFFPPLLALFYRATLKRAPTREDWGTLAILGLAPYASLLPWAATNWALYRRFIPLEDGEAAPIIIGGVLGAVEKEWARPPAELELALRGTGETLVWAVGKVLGDPAAYLAGYARRLRFIFLLNPLLFVFAGLGFWFNRRSRALQALGLLCAYWVLTHACMSMLREYFDPLWPLLAAAAAGGLAPFLPKGPRADGARKASGAALAGVLAGVLVLCLFVYGTIAAHAYAMTRGGAAAEDRRLDAAVARHPGLASLRFERGMRRLDAGQVSRAEPDLAEAARLEPENALHARMLRWSLLHRRAAAGEAAASALLAGELIARKDRPPSLAAPLCARVRAYPALKPDCLALRLSTAERADAGRAEILGALAEAERLAPGPGDRRRMLKVYRGMKEYGPAQAQVALLLEDSPASAGLWIERAELAARLKQDRAARGYLDEARSRRPDGGERARIAELAASVKEAPLPPMRPEPSAAARAVARAAAAAAAKDRAAALGFLAEAGALNPSPAEAYGMIRLYRDMRESAPALALLDGLLALPGDASLPAAREALAAEAVELRLEGASDALKAGDRAAALALARAAGERRPGPGARRRLAGLYAELGEHEPAGALLDELIRAAPADAGLRVERAAAAAAAGNRALASASLDAARRLDPDARARRRMAYLRQDLGDHPAALALFDALVRKSPKDASLRSDRGLSLYLNGRRDDAIGELEAALKLDPRLNAASSTLAAIRAAR